MGAISMVKSFYIRFISFTVIVTLIWISNFKHEINYKGKLEKFEGKDKVRTEVLSNGVETIKGGVTLNFIV